VLWVQAVGKLQQAFKRIRFVRFFELSDTSEAKKSREILLCAVECALVGRQDQAAVLTMGRAY
jgi:hypothetical protein